jgi:Winged helix DNA-binding domain
MDPTEIAYRRLHSLGLEGPREAAPEDVVRRLLAVQGQDYGPAKWSLAERTTGVGDAAVDAAFVAGRFLRTHVLRPTWHFVLPDDIRWLLELTGPRVHAQNRYWYRQAELDGATIAKATALVTEALTGGNRLTRRQVQALLAGAGIEAGGPRLAYILMHAELEGLVCSGALAGRQQTYALLDERAPGARRLDRDEALAELTLRYFAGHGPARDKDLRWWSSLTLAEVRRGLDAVADRLERREVDGETWWSAPSGPPPPVPSPTVHLLQGLDEYFVGYTGNEGLLDAGGTRALPPEGVMFNHVVVLDSQVAGQWKRTVGRDSMLVEVLLYVPFDQARTRALQAAADAQAAFLGTSATVVTRLR